MEHNEYHSMEVGRFDEKILQLRSAQTLRILRKHGNIKNLLEIGPGRGYLGLECKSHNIDYTGIEESKKGCKRLEAMGLVVKNARFPTETYVKYDCIVARAVIEHCKDHREVFDFVKQAKRSLRKGGLLWLEAPDIRFWKFMFWASDYTHNYVCTVLRLVSMSREFELEIKYSTTRSQFLLFPLDRIGWACWMIVDKLLNWPFALLPDWKMFLKFKTFLLKMRLSVLPCAVVVSQKIDD